MSNCILNFNSLPKVHFSSCFFGFRVLFEQLRYPGVAQLVACLNGVQEAGSSNLLTRTSKKSCILKEYRTFSFFRTHCSDAVCPRKVSTSAAHTFARHANVPGERSLWAQPSRRVFSNAASTAAMQLPRKACCSSASTPAIVLPPGLQTSSLSSSGCLPERRTISALPASICAA